MHVGYPEVKMLPLYQQAPALSVRAGQHRARWLSPGVTVSLYLPIPSLSSSPVLFTTQRKSNISRELISTHFTKSIS